MRNLLLITTALAALTACDLSPDYTLPNLFESPAFKEAKVEPKPPEENTPAAEEAPKTVTDEDGITWKRFDEKANIEETAWWKMFGLAELDKLEEQAMSANPSLEVALQRIEAARGQAEIAGANLYPSVSISGGPQRQQSPAASINANLPSGVNVTTKPFTTYTAQGNIAYTLDLFGKNRNTARAAEKDLAAEEQNYRAARLLLQAELAETYIAHASLAAEHEILNRTVTARRQTRDHNKAKYDVGTIDELTYSNYESELANVEAERAAIAQQIAVAEHKIATLIGVEPAQLTLAHTMLKGAPPAVPAGIPASLLERRPDIKSAAQNVAAANARIGAARAGYFPDISFAAVGGYTSIKASDIFKKANQFWAIGPANGLQILTQPLFEGGRLSGTLTARKAEFDAASANYRAASLTAFREVEDSLSGIRSTKEQADARAKGLAAAKRAYAAASERYKIGYSSQLDYLDSERSLLASERAAVQVQGQRYLATIGLIKALGGSWHSTPQPAPIAAAKPAEKPPAEKPAEPAPATPAPAAIPAPEADTRG